MTLAALVLGAALVGPAAPEPARKPGRDEPQGAERGARGWAWGACAATLGDLGTTELVLARGGRETLLMRHRGLRIGVGALSCGGVQVLAGKDAKLARKVGKLAVVVRGLLTVWNVRQALR